MILHVVHPGDVASIRQNGHPTYVGYGQLVRCYGLERYARGSVPGHRVIRADPHYGWSYLSHVVATVGHYYPRVAGDYWPTDEEDLSAAY